MDVSDGEGDYVFADSEDSGSVSEQECENWAWVRSLTLCNSTLIENNVLPKCQKFQDIHLFALSILANEKMKACNLHKIDINGLELEFGERNKCIFQSLDKIGNIAAAGNTISLCEWEGWCVVEGRQ